MLDDHLLDKYQIDVAVQILHETEQGDPYSGAFRVTDGDVTCWLPKSQIKWDPVNKKGETIMYLPTWLASREGLI